MSSPPFSYTMSTTGVIAKAAGVAGFLGGGGDVSVKYGYGTTIEKGTWLSEHALRRHSPYSITTPAGWEPKEPAVKPTSGMVASGVVSAGSIDNSYIPMPLENGWGKARELSKNEKRKEPRKQATDLLCVAKGARMLPPAQTEADMTSVRPAYAPTIPLFHSIDPQRNESGFVRGPNIIPGAKPPPVSALSGYNTAALPQVPPDHALRKLNYDQNLSQTVIPIAKTIRAGLPDAKSTKAAGLPGGLSIIESS